MGANAVRVSFNTKDGKSKEGKSVEEELERVEIKVTEKREDVIRIVLISDTHNRHRTMQMPEGDILIHAGARATSPTTGKRKRSRTLKPGWQVLTTSTRSWCLENTTQEQRRRLCFEMPVKGRSKANVWR